MKIEYQVVKAKTAEEAMGKSLWQVGDVARCCLVRAIANNDKTWSLFAEFEKVSAVRTGEEKP